jgi:hypothetical protein
MNPDLRSFLGAKPNLPYTASIADRAIKQAVSDIARRKLASVVKTEEKSVK